MNRVIHYTDVRDGCCTFRCDNQTMKFSTSNCSGYVYYTNGKDAYFCARPNSYSSPRHIINSSTRWNRVYANDDKKLFVSPDSKMSRDLLRNSGYKIVRDKANADFIVIPSTAHKPMTQMSFNMGFKTKNGILRLLNIHRSDGHDKFTPEDINIIIDIINKAMSGEVEEYYYNDQLVPFGIYFMAKCEEYAEIWEGRVKGTYICDSDVQVIGANTISVETLEVWKHIESQTLLEKTILNSDWQKYPCTVAVFLNNEHPCECASPTGQWRWLLDQIDYDIYDRNMHFGERVVSPEDWNMLQKWALHRLGLDENGGYVTREISKNASLRYKSLLRSRECFMPMFIENGDTSKNLINQVTNA